MKPTDRVLFIVASAVLLSVALLGALPTATGSNAAVRAGGLTVTRSAAFIRVTVEGGNVVQGGRHSDGPTFTTFEKIIPSDVASADKNATASGQHLASVKTTSGGQTTISTLGRIEAKAECPKTPCGGDRNPSAKGSGGVSVEFAASGTFPYKLEVSALDVDGQTENDCASVKVVLDVGGISQPESLLVDGPASTADCRSRGHRSHLTLTHRGTFTAKTGFRFLLTASACCLDPSTKRTDSFSANWDVTLTVGHACRVVGPNRPPCRIR